jgi:hypothetical protein
MISGGSKASLFIHIIKPHKWRSIFLSYIFTLQRHDLYEETAKNYLKSQPHTQSLRINVSESDSIQKPNSPMAISINGHGIATEVQQPNTT